MLPDIQIRLGWDGGACILLIISLFAVVMCIVVVIRDDTDTMYLFNVW